MAFQPGSKLAKLQPSNQARAPLAAHKKALPILGKKDPTTGGTMEDKLVKHIIERMKLSDNERRLRVARCESIDIQLSGFTKLSKEDQKRDRDNKQGKKTKPVETNLPMALAQIDEVVTSLMMMFAPEMEIFSAQSTKDKQHIAEAVAAEMNKQGQKVQYYRELVKFCYDALKYNFAGLTCYWEKQKGIVFTADGAGSQVAKKVDTVWEGNVLKSIDAYNFFFDTSVHPVDLPLKGEYFAEVYTMTPFRARRLADNNQLVGYERWGDLLAPATGMDSLTYYIEPPKVRDNTFSTVGQQVNWQARLNIGGPARDSQPQLELIQYTTWIKPVDFGLSDSKDLEVWRIIVVNGVYIGFAIQLDDTHGQLPCCMGTPLEDDIRNEQRTYAEMLMPLQHFASFLLNTHVAATRKAIYGFSLYDPNVFPGLDKHHDDLIGANIPMRGSAAGIDIDKVFRHYNDAPSTDNNVDMIEKIDALMQKILPSNSAQQVADLDRATEYQAAATVQGNNKRSYKIAAMLAIQCFEPLKFQMFYNLLSNSPGFQYTDDQGQPATITPAQIIDANIEYDIGTGLKGLDRLMQVSILKEILAYVFQSQQAIQQIDVLGLLDWVTSIAGFKTDLTKFRLPPPQPQAGQQGQQAGQAGAGNTPNQPTAQQYEERAATTPAILAAAGRRA